MAMGDKRNCYYVGSICRYNETEAKWTGNGLIWKKILKILILLYISFSCDDRRFYIFRVRVF